MMGEIGIEKSEKKNEQDEVDRMRQENYSRWSTDGNMQQMKNEFV